MPVNATDIVDLLSELGRDDLACRRLALFATQGEPILNVCQTAIRALADERDALRKLVVRMADEPVR